MHISIVYKDERQRAPLYYVTSGDFRAMGGVGGGAALGRGPDAGDPSGGARSGELGRGAAVRAAAAWASTC